MSSAYWEVLELNVPDEILGPKILSHLPPGMGPMGVGDKEQ